MFAYYNSLMGHCMPALTHFLAMEASANGQVRPRRVRVFAPRDLQLPPHRHRCGGFCPRGQAPMVPMQGRGELLRSAKFRKIPQNLLFQEFEGAFSLKKHGFGGPKR